MTCRMKNSVGDISVVIALHNEEGNVKILYERLRCALGSLCRRYELIFVDDNSSDKTHDRLCELFQKDDRVHVIRLKENFGQIIGLVVGINFSRAGTVITMDGDLQHDPGDIGKLLEKINQGYSLVNGRKIKRADNFFIRTIPSFFVKRAVSFFFGLGYCDINSSFRAYRREILRNINQDGEIIRFFPLFAKRRGINFCEVDIQCAKRRFGRTHFGVGGRLRGLVNDALLLVAIYRGVFLRKEVHPQQLIAEIRSHHYGGIDKGGPPDTSSVKETCRSVLK